MVSSSTNTRGYPLDGYSPVALTHPGNTGSYENSPSSAYPPPFSRVSVDRDDNSRGDSFSVHSHAPLAPRANTEPMPTMPGMPVPRDYSRTSSATKAPGSQSTTGLTHRTQNSSWDLLAGLRKEAEGFDTRNATESHLQFAQGDMPNTKFVRVYNYLLNVSIVTRWTLFIVPVLTLLWIPGILGLTRFPDATIYHVKLLWWSVWLSVVWGGWWCSLAVARILPRIARNTIGIVAVGTRKYIDWLEVLVRYVALFSWTLIVWITYVPLIVGRVLGDKPTQISFLANLLFGIYLCAALLLFEKLSIQWIAAKFHERSYADRIADQKLAIRILVTLYSHSSELPGRSDALKDRDATQKPPPADPKKFFKKALNGVRTAATTTTTALGNVASEIAGSSVLQPNSPQAMVQTALRSANKTRLLARRLFYSFCQPGADALVLTDIAPFFHSYEAGQTAFTLFDRDGNGDVTREEVELACLDIHREQLSIEHSMRDLDSAVGRLDNILMSLYVVIAALIIVVVLDRQVVSLLTGAGAFILGLSWLIGSSLQEVLSSIIFLFIKHPYDVGDRVEISKDPKETYTVKEIRLLSTIFLDGNSCLVQAPNSVLTTLLIHNLRRSPQMTETFEFDVAYDTTFEQIEQLRAKMLAFVRDEGRDFLPSFDVIVKDIPEQEKMTLSADIKYKSNWQQGALRVKRRNKWICALKTSLAELKIFGPAGDPDAEKPPKMYTEIPWDEVKRIEEERKRREAGLQSFIKSEYDLADKNTVAMNDDDVFGEAEQMYMTNPRRGYTDSSTAGSSRMPSRTNSSGPSRVMPGPPPAMPLPQTPEAYEMGATAGSGHRMQGST
ncbi:hypothetical protein ACEPAF_7609 [Sanghuangporus sanghuang]